MNNLTRSYKPPSIIQGIFEIGCQGKTNHHSNEYRDSIWQTWPLSTPTPRHPSIPVSFCTVNIIAKIFVYYGFHVNFYLQHVVTTMTKTKDVFQETYTLIYIITKITLIILYLFSFIYFISLNSFKQYS